MTQEDKKLLLRDLCGRLPYGVICKDTNINVIGTISQIGLHYDMCELDKDNGDSEYCYIPNCKPYLFPFYSMSDEQKKEWRSLMRCGLYGMVYPTIKSFDYLYKNHIDIRGLIEKGLAIDATNLNIY